MLPGYVGKVTDLPRVYVRGWVGMRIEQDTRALLYLSLSLSLCCLALIHCNPAESALHPCFAPENAPAKPPKASLLFATPSGLSSGRHLFDTWLCSL